MEWTLYFLADLEARVPEEKRQRNRYLGILADCHPEAGQESGVTEVPSAGGAPLRAVVTFRCAACAAQGPTIATFANGWKEAHPCAHDHDRLDIAYRDGVLYLLCHICKLALVRLEVASEAAWEAAGPDPGLL